MRRQQDADPGVSGGPNLWLVVAAGTIPLAALAALFIFDVPIGQPFFLIYRYSPLALIRAWHALPILVIGTVALWALWKGFNQSGRLPLWSALTATGGFAAAVVWVFVAPPQPAVQHNFNFQSPSHDGAFIIEARGVESVSDYVSRTFSQRLELSPEQMRGRRVLSNPPGVTAAVVGLRRAVLQSDGLRSALIRWFDLGELEDLDQRDEFAAAMLLAVLFTAAWGASFVFGYLLCRPVFPQSAAACVAFAIVFNPAAVEFTPGKDPAQLATVLLILCGWVRAYLGRGRVWAAAAGAGLAVGLMIGLVHLWIAAIVAGATLLHGFAARRSWHAPRGSVSDHDDVHGNRPIGNGGATRAKRSFDFDYREHGPTREGGAPSPQAKLGRAHSAGTSLFRWLARCAFPAAAGFVLVAALAYALLDWNLLLSTWRVARRYGQIQLPVITEPFYWTLLGAPMFLLFCGPLLWVLMIAIHGRQRDNLGRLGKALLAITLVVMAYTYFFANNSETPRLWIPFVPLLLFGLAAMRPALRGDTRSLRALHVLLIALQLGVTVAHWSLMDVRESEWRLLTKRMWD